MLQQPINRFHKTLMIILALFLAGAVYLATINTIAYLDNSDSEILWGLIKKHKKSSATIQINNILFYPTTITNQLYSDKETDMVKGIGSICVVSDLSDKTIQVKYQGDDGSVNIVKGSSPGCPPTVLVEDGIFTPSALLTPTPTPTATPTSSWKTFSKQNFGFTFKYPKDWSITSSSIKDQVRTVNVNTGEGKFSIWNPAIDFATEGFTATDTNRITATGIKFERILWVGFDSNEFGKNKGKQRYIATRLEEDEPQSLVVIYIPNTPPVSSGMIKNLDLMLGSFKNTTD